MELCFCFRLKSSIIRMENVGAPLSWSPEPTDLIATQMSVDNILN
jgi:hypothetical protein